MKNITLEKWIWLPKDKYPEKQTTCYSALAGEKKGYTVAEFKRTYTFNKKIASSFLRFSGDTSFRLYCNESLIATGPVVVEGDFLGNARPRNNFYATETTLYPDGSTLDFFASVKMMPVQICEYSKGHGGFMLTAIVTFEDGTKTVVSTDSSWLVRYNGAHHSPYAYDSRIQLDEYVNAEETDNIWHTVTAPLSIRTEKEITPAGGGKIAVAPKEKKEVILDLDMIYAGYICLDVKTKGVLSVNVLCREIDENGSGEYTVFDEDEKYIGFQLHSAGKLAVTLDNLSEHPAEVTVSFVSTYYPINNEVKTQTSDSELNRVLEVCAHTLKICRQTHHLDSPRHCEPMACTGDYYIESLMTAARFGDMSLAEFDVIRTAELLRYNDGRMFHTTYSLIWVKMLYDVYMFTGNKSLLEKCEDALILLMNRFEGYVSEDGFIDNPPDYMFVDWIYIDGLSMHHPPKALGQTSLNMFYFGALDAASKVFAELGDASMSQKYASQKEALKKAVNTILFDSEKGMYFEGLNTETPKELIGQFMPENTDKRYYLKHSNILAAYVGICDNETAKALLEKVITDEIEGDYQPYFAHYLLEAVCDNGLRDKYTLKLLEKWKKPVLECEKGLVEGFIMPEPSYSFDHSHAWGGTPLYSLPKALLGLKVTKPGMKEIELSPSLLGLEAAKVYFPSPVGNISCEMMTGKEPVLECPDGICVILK